MKRIKALNGYTIYQVTERDAKNDGKTAGEYEIYFSSDIREYGLQFSYAEYDGIDSLEIAIELCNGSNFAIAKELAEVTSTAPTFDEITAIETMLDAGISEETIYNTERGKRTHDYYYTFGGNKGEKVKRYLDDNRIPYELKTRDFENNEIYYYFAFNTTERNATEIDRMF